MKRLALCASLVLVLVCSIASAQPKTNETTSSMRKLCYRLWKHSNFGWDEKQTERAAWIVRDPDGTFRWLEWDYTEEHHAATWKHPLPERVVAQIHTHPGFTDPRPSKQDIRVAREIKAPVYTISNLGIWKAGPDGTVTQEADDKWYQDQDIKEK